MIFQANFFCLLLGIFKLLLFAMASYKRCAEFRYEDVQHRRENDREKINQWQHAIDDAQSELEMLRARWRQLTEEEKRLNGDNARIWEELQKARNVSILKSFF